MSKRRIKAGIKVNQRVFARIVCFCEEQGLFEDDEGIRQPMGTHYCAAADALNLMNETALALLADLKTELAA